MDEMCFAWPLVRGKSEEARTFLLEAERRRWSELTASERRNGIARVSWYLQRSGNADLLLGHIECWDLARTAWLLAESSDPYDAWFRQRLVELTGVDMPSALRTPAGEQVSRYDATGCGV